MFLHGSQEYPDVYSQVTEVTCALKNNKFDYNAIIISPIAHAYQESRDQTRLNAAKAISDYVAKNYKVNKNKISLCALCEYINGASGAWTLLNQNNGYFTAALLY